MRKAFDYDYYQYINKLLDSELADGVHASLSLDGGSGSGADVGSPPPDVVSGSHGDGTRDDPAP